MKSMRWPRKFLLKMISFSCIYCVCIMGCLQVDVVSQMVKISKSMRCYLKGTSTTPLVQFSGCSEDMNDPGDGGGIPVFTFRSISCFGMSSLRML